MHRSMYRILCVPALLILAFSTVSLAIQPELSARESYLNDYDTLISKLAANYAGWETKLTPDTQPGWDALVSAQRAIVAEAKDDAAVLAAMRRVLGFFRDGHLSIHQVQAESGASASGTPAALPDHAAWPTLDWSEADIRAAAEVKGPQASMVGVWVTANGRYKLGIKPDADEILKAMVLETTAEGWAPKQVKATLSLQGSDGLSGTWVMGDHSVQPFTGRLVAEGTAVLDVAGKTVLRRVYPAAAIVPVAQLARSMAWPEVFVEKLSDRTAWIRVPSFQDAVAPVLDSLLRENAALLDTAENLIIDCRQNGGGSDYVYGSLTPLIASRPVYTVSVQIRCSPDNIAAWEKLLEQPEIPPEQRERLAERIALMRANAGRYYTPENACDIEVPATVKPFPKRVAVLIEGAASTGEQFILEAMQSRKVTLFGKGNSAGVLDFANIRQMPLPSGKFLLVNPTSRSLRLPAFPVDPDGIAPDVKIPAHVSDEIGFVQSWLERQASETAP